MLYVTLFQSLRVKDFSRRFLHGAAFLALLCLPLWILPLLGNPIGHLPLIILGAAAVLLPLLVTPSACPLLSNLMRWEHLRTSSRTQQSSEVPEAINAILQLTHGSRGISCGYRTSCDPSAYIKGITLTSLQPAVTISKTVTDTPKVRATLPPTVANGDPTSRSTSLGPHKSPEAAATYPPRKSGEKSGPKSALQPAPLLLPANITPQRSVEVSVRVGGSSLKAPVGLSRCTIAEDAPFPPPNTQVVMELHEKTLRVGGRRLRYRGYRPADRILTLPLPVSVAPAVPQNPFAVQGSTSPCAMGLCASCGGDSHTKGCLNHTKNAGTAGAVASTHQPYLLQPGDPSQTPLGIHHEAAVGANASPAPSNASVELGGSIAALNHMRPYQANPQVYPHHQHYGNHLSLSIKVPWADPSALPAGGGGLLESLNAALASGSGYMVVGATVRPGCMLLQVDVRATTGTSVDVLRRISNVGQHQTPSDRDHGVAADAAETSGGELAAQLARHVSMLAPTPPDGSRALVSIGGWLSYAFSYNEPAAEWTAVPVAWDEECLASGGGFGTKATLLQHLHGPHSVQLRSENAAAVVPREPQTTLPHMLMLSLRIEVTDEAAAAQLAEELRPLLLSAHKAEQMQMQPQPGQQQGPRHGAADGWQIVANCLGRSLPLRVLRVAGPSRSADMAGIGHLAAVAEDVEHAEHTTATATRAVASARTEMLYVTVGVLGTREALEGVSCRLGLLSVELWYGIQEIAQVPIMLIHESVALSPCKAGLRQPAAARKPAGRCPADTVDSALTTAASAPEDAAALSGSPPRAPMGLAAGSTSPGTGDDTAAAVVKELNWLAAVAAAGSSSEDEQCVWQMLTDLGILELYTVSQCLRSAEMLGDKDEGEPTGGGGCGGAGCHGHVSVTSSSTATAADLPSSCSPSLPISSSTLDVPAGSMETDTADRQHLDLPLRAPAAVLLPGSVDMSAQLQRLLGRTDSQQRHSMLLVAANLLAYTVLHAMPYTANAIQKALAALGCELAEAEELSASAEKASEREECFVNASGSDDGAAVTGQLGGAAVEWDDFDEHGLPLVHLAVLSGNLAIVQMVLQWAAEEGLGAGWVMRRHRGRSPLQMAAAAAAGAGGSTSSSVHAEYLAQLRKLLPVEQSGDEDARAQAVTTMAEAPPSQELAAPAAAVEEEEDIGLSKLAKLRRLLTEGGSSCCSAGGESSAMLNTSHSTAATSAASVPITPAVAGIQPADMLLHCEQSHEDGSISCGVSGVLDRDVEHLRSPRNAATTAAPDSRCIGRSNDGQDGDCGKVACPRGDSGTAADAIAHATADGLSITHHANAADLRLNLQRRPLVICLLGYTDPVVEARYQQFALRYDVRMVSYWIPCLFFLVACSLLRLLHSDDETNETYPSRVAVVLLFAWPYMVLVAALVLRTSLVYRRLPSWWLLCGAARISIKWLSFLGLVSMPPPLLRYMRSSLAMVVDTLLPVLCERVPGLPGVLLRLLDAAAHCAFLLHAGLVPSLSAATVHTLLRGAVLVGAALIVEIHYRASFETAVAVALPKAAAVAAAPGGGGRRHCAGGADWGPPCSS